MNVGEILSLFPEESIMNWIEKFPDEGALYVLMVSVYFMETLSNVVCCKHSLVKLLRTTSFIHPKTSHFIKHLESLLEKTRTRRACEFAHLHLYFRPPLPLSTSYQLPAGW